MDIYDRVGTGASINEIFYSCLYLCHASSVFHFHLENWNGLGLSWGLLLNKVVVQRKNIGIFAFTEKNWTEPILDLS